MAVCGLALNLFISIFLDSGRPGTSTLNRFSALQSGSLMSATDSDRRVPQRYSEAPNIFSLIGLLLL